MTVLLQKGDIIRLEKGMRIYADIPESCYFENSWFSDKIFHGDITIGEVYHRQTEVSKKEVVSSVFKNINYLIPITEEQVSSFVESLNLDFRKKFFDTSFFEGVYEVTRTEYNGGGSQPAMCVRGLDTYPDGWHVYCRKVDAPDVKVDFYQSGCFTAMIEDITPIR